jgi:hypothetical protein
VSEGIPPNLGRVEGDCLLGVSGKSWAFFVVVTLSFRCMLAIYGIEILFSFGLQGGVDHRAINSSITSKPWLAMCFSISAGKVKSWQKVMMSPCVFVDRKDNA